MKFFLFAFVVLLNACGQKPVSQSQILGTLRDGATCEKGLNAFRDSVHKLVRENCTACHEQSQPANGPKFAVDDVETSYTRMLGLMSFNDIEHSKLVSYGGNRHCLTRYNYPCTPDHDQVLAAAKAWWENGEKECPAKGNFFTRAVKIPENLPVHSPTESKFIPVRFSLSHLPGTLGPKTTFQIEMQKFTDEGPSGIETSYRFREPRLLTETSAIRLKGIRVLVNGRWSPSSTSFLTIDQVTNPKSFDLQSATTTFPNLSRNSQIVLADKGEADEIAFSFEDVKIDDAVVCKNPEKFKNTFLDSRQLNVCFACHGGGASHQPGRAEVVAVFPFDQANDQLCAEFKQRVSKDHWLDSVLVNYPLDGLFGHGAFIQTRDVEPIWVSWMKGEYAP